MYSICKTVPYQGFFHIGHFHVCPALATNSRRKTLTKYKETRVLTRHAACVARGERQVGSVRKMFSCIVPDRLDNGNPLKFTP
jgi:hypothetical protein